MKGTNVFKQTIKQYLDSRAANDELFAVSYSKEGKNIDDCITYILNQVKKSGCAGFADDEIYNMAVHYYDEDNLDVGKPIRAQVAVNHVVELTEEDKQKAKDAAIQKLVEENAKKLQTPKAEKKAKPKVEAPSLFDI